MWKTLESGSSLHVFHNVSFQAILQLRWLFFIVRITSMSSLYDVLRTCGPKCTGSRCEETEDMTRMNVPGKKKSLAKQTASSAYCAALGDNTKQADQVLVPELAHDGSFLQEEKSLMRIDVILECLHSHKPTTRCLSCMTRIKE